jgi:hypothetical protein
MRVRLKGTLVPFALAGFLAVAAVQVWSMAMEGASLALLECSAFWVFSAAAQCRWPAIYVGIGWILFTGALACGWIGWVRQLTKPARETSVPPHDGHPSI